MTKGLYKETVEYGIIELNEDWLASNLAFWPDQPKDCISLFDKCNPSFYLSFLIYNVWEKLTNSGDRHLNCDYRDLVQTCIALLYERQTDGVKTNLALGKNGKLYKYANKITGAEGDFEFLYTKIKERLTVTCYGLALYIQDYYTKRDGEEVYIEIKWL